MSQTLSVDLGNGDVSLSAADLAGVVFVDLMRAPSPAISTKRRAVNFGAVHKSVTVRSTTSMGADVLLVRGNKVITLQQYHEVTIRLDGSANGIEVVPARDDVSSVLDLLDVDATSIKDGDALVFDASTSTFKGGAAGNGGSSASGRAEPLSKAVDGNADFSFPHSFGYQPEVWAVDADGAPCVLDYAYGEGVVNFTFHQTFKGTVYLG